MKLRSQYALMALLLCAAPYAIMQAAGDLIEATSLQHLQSIIAQHDNIVVDFYATWCGPCQRMGPVFAQLPGAFQNQNIIFVKINVDLAGSTYGVRMLPTIVYFARDAKDNTVKEIYRTSGFKQFNVLSQDVKNTYKNLFSN